MTGEPSPIHQRRFLVLSGESAGDAVVEACVRWQHEYVGAVYVSGGEAVVRRFVAAGCSPQLVTFYDPARVPGLRELSVLLGRFSERPGLALAELIAIAPTDVVGAPADVLESARSVAATVNRTLGSAELPVPERVASLDPDYGEEPALASALAWGSGYVELECEQQTDLLYEALLHEALPAGVA
ncbi:MAG TPA: hypothetical protein VGR06_18760 [Actinophytocola sp.]|uniref:hypothetical protein n=1 Tax=Actinophytocola sp. TaxID=1872138 RepID=UPI002E079829|nr:hypothetical protein [Actinophytocola sp.]